MYDLKSGRSRRNHRSASAESSRSWGHAGRRGVKDIELDDTKRQSLRYRSGLTALLNGTRAMLETAPPELNCLQESIHSLLTAAYYILDIEAPNQLFPNSELIRRAMEELNNAVGPLGLVLDFRDKSDA
jgi:hypothetical protein